MARRRALVEEKQRRSSDSNGGADHAGGKAAQRRGESDDADEQRRRIGNGQKITIDRDGDESRRRRQSRTADCAPVEPHACSRSLPGMTQLDRWLRSRRGFLAPCLKGG